MTAPRTACSPLEISPFDIVINQQSCLFAVYPSWLDRAAAGLNKILGRSNATTATPSRMMKKTHSAASNPAASCVPRSPAAPAAHQHTYRWISVLLVLGHVLETALQIYLIHHYWQLTTRWAAGLAALLTATVAIINAASIIGVRRGLDFADRWFGQCLCYVMHFSLLGIVWRFLKLTFLYDRTDLREFALLRFVQVNLLDS